MSDYTPAVDFSVKDALATGNSSKLIVGAELDTEFDAISTAVNTKVDGTGAQVEVLGAGNSTGAWGGFSADPANEVFRTYRLGDGTHAIAWVHDNAGEKNTGTSNAATMTWTAPSSLRPDTLVWTNTFLMHDNSATADRLGIATVATDGTMTFYLLEYGGVSHTGDILIHPTILVDFSMPQSRPLFFLFQPRTFLYRP